MLDNHIFHFIAFIYRLIFRSSNGIIDNLTVNMKASNTSSNIQIFNVV